MVDKEGESDKQRFATIRSDVYVFNNGGNERRGGGIETSSR